MAETSVTDMFPALGPDAETPSTTTGAPRHLRTWSARGYRSQAVAARPGMRDEGSTQRWFGLTSRQFRKVITGSHDGGPDRDQA